MMVRSLWSALGKAKEKLFRFRNVFSVCSLTGQQTVTFLLAQVNLFCRAVALSAQIVVRPALESTVVCRGFIWTHMIFIMRGE